MKRLLGMLLAAVFLPLLLPSLAAENTTVGSVTQAAQTLIGMGLGQAVFDPANELVTWNGRTWNINNNRLFESQFERYLNTPSAAPSSVTEYEQLLASIRDLLSPAKVSPASVDEAFRSLRLAAAFEIDGNISDVLSGQIYATWLSQKDRARMENANQALLAERSRLEWNMKLTAQGTGLTSVPAGKSNELAVASARRVTEATEMQPMVKRLAEVEALLKKNGADKEVAAAQARADFQVLIVQLFLQRRFAHVPITIGFYRALFNEGGTQVRLGEEATNLFSKTTGSAPTLASLDAASREMTQIVRQGLKAFEVMLANRQLGSASKRLSEAYVIGQNLPDLDLVPLAAKQTVLAFTRKTNRLLSAIEVKDYTQAESLLAEIQTTGLDFDPTKANAVIQSSKLAAEMHLAKARNAAVSADKATLETELKAAAEIWPTNPQLRELSARIFQQADVGAQAISDFDQLLSQRNFRRIYDDKMRFIAATATNPERQETLRKILDDITEIEIAIQRASEIEKQGNAAGAWESIESIAKAFPEDPKLNQTRANLTVKAAAFAHLIQTAENNEKRNQPASALTTYLAAQKQYPLSHLAKEGILRIITQLYPDTQ